VCEREVGVRPVGSAIEVVERPAAGIVTSWPSPAVWRVWRSLREEECQFVGDRLPDFSPARSRCLPARSMALPHG